MGRTSNDGDSSDNVVESTSSTAQGDELSRNRIQFRSHRTNERVRTRYRYECLSASWTELISVSIGTVFCSTRNRQSESEAERLELTVLGARI
jgi:hypothetical protein